MFSQEEGRIRKFILQGRKAAEAKDIVTCAGMVSMKYQDKYGNDRASLIYTGNQVFAYYKDIFVYIEKIDIKLDDSKTEAKVEIVATVLGHTVENKTEHILEKGKGRFQVRLVKENKKWLVRELEFLEPVTLMGQGIS